MRIPVPTSVGWAVRYPRPGAETKRSGSASASTKARSSAVFPTKSRNVPLTEKVRWLALITSHQTVVSPSPAVALSRR